MRPYSDSIWTHRLIGEILERTHPQNINDVAPLLARHFDEADDLARALKYYIIAGDAAALADEFITYIQRTGARTFLPETLYLKSQTLLPASKNEVYQLLIAAQQEAESLGSHRILWKILFARSDLEKGEAAGSLRRQARQIVATIADDISQADLRESFLNRGDIRELM